MSVVSLRDLEIIAGQKTPHDMWDFIDGAAFDEVTKRRNLSKFEEIVGKLKGRFACYQ